MLFSGVHAPSFEAPFTFVHTSHGPALHAVSQQTPSTQEPLAHSDAAPQATPGTSLGEQLPAEQNCAAGQSLS